MELCNFNDLFSLYIRVYAITRPNNPFEAEADPVLDAIATHPVLLTRSLRVNVFDTEIDFYGREMDSRFQFWLRAERSVRRVLRAG